MLKKLIKYELSLFEKKLVHYYLFFIIFSLVMGFVPQFMINNFEVTVAQTLNEIMYMFYLVAVFYAVLSPLFVGHVVAKNMMFSDNAYLVRTLPIKVNLFVVCHVLVTYVVFMINAFLLWLELSISLTDNSYVSMISATFVKQIKDVALDVKQTPMILAVLAGFTIVTILFVVFNELCVLFVKECFHKNEKRPKYVIMLLSLLLLCVLMLLLVSSDEYETLLNYTIVFAVFSVVEGIIITRMNKTCYNLT
ncbi:MAG: hypothetical protein IJC65_03990 [Oscillospiraceae bacterium]|nr:hypothetical protein [Oscillospiraceae bacterium]